VAKSSLYAIRNGSVTFHVSGSVLETDPRTGNVSGKEVNLTYDIYYDSGDGIDTSELAGADLNRKTLDCYVVSPRELDSRIITGTRCTVKTEKNKTFKGKVRNTKYPSGTIGTLGATLTQVLGDRVEIEQYWGS
jgi:hypothetical protein